MFLFFASASKSSPLWELNVYDGGWMCVMGFCVACSASATTAELCFLSLYIFGLKGKKILCFMYSRYVISSFLITILKRYYFVFSGQQFGENN